VNIDAVRSGSLGLLKKAEQPDRQLVARTAHCGRLQAVGVVPRR
jgi:hypothetical protein